MTKKIVYIIVLMMVATTALTYFSRGSENAYGYDNKGKRDPFVPLIGLDKGAVRSGLEGVISIQDITLEGIAISPSGKNIAIMNGQMVKEKDRFGIVLIKSISKKTVELSIEGKDYKLSLQEEEGAKVGK